MAASSPGGNLYAKTTGEATSPGFSAAVAYNRDGLDRQVAAIAASASAEAAAIVPRMEQIEVMAGLAPGDVTDAQTANLITQPDTLSRDALNAAIVQGAASKGIEATVSQHGVELSSLQADVSSIPDQVQAQVPPLVAQAIAADPTVSQAAATAAAGAVQDTGVVTWEPGRNLYDYTRDTLGHYVINGTGAVAPLANYRASDFIPVVAGQPYTISHARQVAVYDAGRAYVTGYYVAAQGVQTFTPDAKGFVRFSYAQDAATGVPDASTVQVEKGTTRTATEPFVRLVSGVTLQGASADPLTVSRAGDALSIRATIDGKALAINATLAGGGNRVFNFTSTTLDGSTVHVTSDEPAPIRTQHGTIGANHGFALLGAWPSSAHSKTTADLGSTWTDGAREYVLLGIDGTGRAILGGDYTRDGNGVVQSATVAPAADLTHVSGATNTAAFPLASKLAVGVAQLWPIIQRIRQTVLIDGVTLTPGTTTTGREVQVRESYEILDYASLYDTAKANVGVSYTALRVAGAVRHETTYTFREGGVCAVDNALTEMQPTTLGQCGAVQAVALSGAVTRYVPGVKPIGGHDWSSGVDMTGYTANQLVKTADLHNPKVPPVLSIDIRSDLGFTLGYKPWAGGATGNAERLAETPANLWDLRATKKSYPTAISAEPAGWGRVEAHAIRAYLTPARAAVIASGGTDALAAWAALESETALP